MTEAPSAVASGEVEGLVADLVGGRLRGVLLTGAPGAGKSTTLDALGRRLLDHGVDTRRVGADDVGRRPFGVVTDLLGLDPVYPPRPDTPDQIVAALESQSGPGPLALCVDDAHRADPDSLDLLARVADLAPDLPLVTVLARRTAPERPALTALARHPDVRSVTVSGLGPGALDAMVRARCGAPPGARLATLLAGADGNPFRARILLDELDRRRALRVEDATVRLDDAEGGVSDSVEAAVRAHLAMVEPPVREVVQTLAVWGGAADLATLADLLGAGAVAAAGTADLAADAGLVRWLPDGRVTLAHDLYGDVVLADLDAPVRRALHAACAAAQRRRGDATTAIARHDASAHDADAPATVHRAATELEHAPLAAAELLGEVGGELTGDERAADQLAVDRAGALAISGQVAAAERTARDRLARSRDPATHAALRGVLLFCLVSGADVDGALAEIAASRARAPSDEARAALADIERWVRLLAGHDTLEGPAATPAVSRSGLISDAVELLLAGRARDGFDRAERAAAMPPRNGARPWTDSPSAPVWPAFVALYADGPGRARELSVAARRRAQEAGRLWLTPYHHSVSAGIDFVGGAWDDALAEVESGLEAAAATGTAWTSLTTATRLQILVRRGELADAETTLDRWRARGLPEQFGLPQVTQAQALLLEAREQTADAAALARRGWEQAIGRGRVIWPLIAGPDTLRIARTAGDDDLAALVVRDTAAVPLEQAVAVAPAARLVAAVGAHDADGASRAALDFRATGHLPGEVSAWEEAACLAAAGGDGANARVAGARATALAASLGATTTERRVSARLRHLGVRLGVRGTRRRPTTGWESLTATELQVAELVGRGLTSPQVAARLYISPRTVQTHITHILRKLGLRSRVELAAHLSRRPT
ncbi:LuxR family transcriptional regulator [Actinomycetospora chlora]|uniref:LuxR family transcriptional regulator n=1 Tax=Actinomycetospora chlora TaxID=663608 RepID=A0ABP9BXV3_9PSEU